MNLRPIASALLASTLLATSGAAIAQQVGTAGAVNPASTGTPPSRPTRVLELGSNVVYRERINTAGGGNVQLVFLDKTTMSIGPNSTVVIDEFVYDPNAGTGKLTASMAKGVLRFVGGNTSHSGGAEIKTPSATLGIRGGVATVEIVPCTAATGGDCGTKVTNHFGILTVTSAAGTEIIRRPGFVVAIPGPTAAPSAPRKVTQQEVNRTNASLTSKPGQTGGASATRVSEAAVDRANIAGPVIAQIGSSVASVQSQNQAAQASVATTLGLTVSPTSATTPTQIANLTNGGGTLQTTAQVTDGIVVATGGNESNPIQPGIAAGQAFALSYTGPQSPQSLVPGTTYNSPILGYADGGTVGDTGKPNTSARILQAGLGINGQGAAQSSTLYVVVGRSFVGDTGSPVLSAGFTGSQRSGANRLPIGASGGIVGSGSGVSLGSAYALTGFTDARPGQVDTSGAVTPGTGTILTYPGRNASNFDYRIGAQATATPSGLGSNRPAIDSVPQPLFGGLLGGLVTTVNNTTGVTGSTNILSGLFDLTFDPKTSQFGTTLSVNAVPSGGNQDGNALSYALLDYGKPVDNIFTRPTNLREGRGTFVDYSNFGARDARTLDGAAISEVNGATVADHRGVFVTSDTVNARASFPNVSFCQCEYTKWGFWSSETTRTSTSGQSLTDLVHLGTWVFGDQTRDVDIPSVGTATYAGHAIASIKNGTAEYVAAGNFQNVVNFGTGTGAATVTGLDGRNYTGTVTAGGGSNSINGTLASSVAGSTMSLNGQFSRGVSGPAGEMGGTVTIGGTPGYIGSGIFAASGPAPR